jgi:hypothetical protein
VIVMRSRRLVSLVVLSAIGVVVPLAACDGDRQSIDALPEQRLVAVAGALVGEVASSGALVAVVPADGSIGVYVCDGDTAGRGGAMSKWFRAPWDGRGAVNLVNGGSRVELTPASAGFNGVLVTESGTRHRFSVQPPPTDDDGLFRVEHIDAASRRVVAAGDTIRFREAERGAFVSVVTRCRRIVKQVVLADGTTTAIVVEICR